MPIYNNNYVAPVWINDMPPAIDQDEMRAMSQTIQASQVLVGTGAPTQYTTGVVGQRYADTSTTPYTIYKLVTAAEDANVWVLDESARNLALDYDPTATYAAGDYCIYGGALYRANTDIAQPEAWTAAHWTRAYLADDLAEHVSDTNNPHEVTAQQAGAISKTPDYSFHKDSGWYRFLTINISSGRSNSILLLVQDTYSDGGTSIPYKAIISLYITRQSSGSFYSSANLLTGVGFTKDGFYYTYDSSSGNVSIYVFKKTNTNGYIGVTVISSLNRAASYVDLSDSFESTAIATLPEGGWYFQAMQDGAGNVIPDTYATKAEVSELDAEDVGAVPITRTVNGKALSADIELDTEDIPYDGTVSGITVTTVKGALDHIPTGSDQSPYMNGIPSAGASYYFSKSDHVHPSDTSRVPISRSVNGKELRDDIVLSAADVGAASEDSIAPAELKIAGTNYAVGDHLMLDGVLYEVTVAISSGETITPGTNVSATTVTGITDGLDTRTTALETALDGLVSQLAQM